MISKKKSQKLVDFLKKPVLTEKTTKFLEQKQYTFEVDVQLTKTQIKQIFEQYYGRKIKSVQTNRVQSVGLKSLIRPRKRVRLHFVDNISFLSQ
uniref:Large ribosomal subunit protein uL23c n=1 Tax=Johnson-sea-linkia profunda TaxID=575876 RepID=A0A386AXR2_9CHLO|nr:ribosomal protein L23 [Johnson-sea-linkia profunda]